MTNIDYATAKLAEQKQRIRQLEKEVDWLAGHLADYCKADHDWTCHDKTKTDCINCKIKEARKYVGGYNDRRTA